MNELSTRKILHITFNMEIGGTEQVIKQILLGSDKDRFEHGVLCIDGHIGRLGKELQGHGIDVVSLRRKQGFDYSLVRELRRFVQSKKVDVLHCHQYTPFSYGVLSAIGLPVRLLFTEHGRFFPDRHHLKRRIVNPFLAAKAQHITAISIATADALSEFDYISRSKIKVIYNGIQDVATGIGSRAALLGELGLSDSYRYLGTVARLQPIKNQKMMLQAFKIVSDAVPRLKLIIIGDGPSRIELEHMAEELGLADNVYFLGFLDNPPKFMSVFEVFLLSSLSEGTSMTLLEAMCFGTPCIATDVGGNAEVVVDGKTGLITPSDNVRQFAAAVCDLVNSDERRLEMSVASRERFLSVFSAKSMVDQYQDLY